MPRPQQMTKTTARVVLATCCISLLCGLGALLFAIILMEQGYAISREAVVAMNDTERLADFERLVQQERLITSLIFGAALIVGAIFFVLGFRQIKAALRAAGGAD